VPGGNCAKASSVGAKTVNGPGDCSASTSPAAWTAATKVVKLSLLTAISTIFGMRLGIYCCGQEIQCCHELLTLREQIRGLSGVVRLASAFAEAHGHGINDTPDFEYLADELQGA
jgi:hypothetical protein